MALEYVLNIKDNGTAVIKNISNNVIGLQQNLIGVDAQARPDHFKGCKRQQRCFASSFKI